jgi:hypothetical protein
VGHDRYGYPASEGEWGRFNIVLSVYRNKECKSNKRVQKSVLCIVPEKEFKNPESEPEAAPEFHQTVVV